MGCPVRDVSPPSAPSGGREVEEVPLCASSRVGVSGGGVETGGVAWGGRPEQREE